MINFSSSICCSLSYHRFWTREFCVSLPSWLYSLGFQSAGAGEWCSGETVDLSDEWLPIWDHNAGHKLVNGKREYNR